jgi:uncharacterized transporter YbjL
MILAGGFLAAVAIGFFLSTLDLSLSAVVLIGLGVSALLTVVALLLELLRQRGPESPA